MSDINGFESALIMLQSAFRVELDFLQLEAYRQGLNGVSERLLKEAVVQIIKTEKKFPAVATILEYKAAAYRKLGPTEYRELPPRSEGAQMLRDCSERLAEKMTMRDSEPKAPVQTSEPEPVDPRFTHVPTMPSPAVCPECGSRNLATPYRGTRTGLWLSLCKDCRSSVRSSAYFTIQPKAPKQQQPREPGQEG